MHLSCWFVGHTVSWGVHPGDHARGNHKWPADRHSAQGHSGASPEARRERAFPGSRLRSRSRALHRRDCCDRSRAGVRQFTLSSETQASIELKHSTGQSLSGAYSAGAAPHLRVDGFMLAKLRTTGFASRSNAHVPVILQSEASECGLACLAMILGSHAHQYDLRALRDKYSPSSKGMTLRRLIDIAHDTGLSARPLRIELEYAQELRLPCILHWGLLHYVVLA